LITFRHVAFTELEGFSDNVTRLLSDSEYARLQKSLALDPEKGDLIRHTGGARKIRIRLSGRGKRGGGRVVYYYQVTDVIHLLLIYSKSELEDLTPHQLKWIRDRVEEIKKGGK
jgi:mRNA-degrading endonuclease RelE of RelBE toxin-antitoxin system